MNCTIGGHKLTASNPYFCILPWIHMHIWPNGTTYPCCLSTNDYKLGNTNESSFLDIWNSERMRELRLNILNGKPTSGCSKCYEHEKNGAMSMRMNLNRDYEHQYNRIELTNENGSLDEIFMAYMDIRFSNICNFKCRTCGPELSSFWVDDAVKMNRYSSTQPKILKIKNTLEELWQDMEQWIDTVEKIYFAGGEPLIMDEHYKILEYLIKIGKTDINIFYNTNLSKLQYKNKNVIELWKQFSKISVGASIDGMNGRAEYLRSGTNWCEIEKNRERLLTELPEVEFHITSTISAYNVEHCPDFFNDWINKGFISATDIDCNVLLYPKFQRAQVLPEYKRKQIQEKYLQFISDHKLKEIVSAQHRYVSFNAVVDSLNEDLSELLPEFINHAKSIDQLRNEYLTDSFPELSYLYV